MQNIYTIIFIILISFANLVGQIEQVSVGKEYSQQAYYNLSTGEVSTLENDSWDIAFSNLGQQDAGLFINESSSLSSGVLKLFNAHTNDWSTNISNTSMFADSLILFNDEASWTHGAFNSILDVNNPFDYGWGAYNPQTHLVEGNTVFIIQKRNGTFLKFQMISLEGGQYNFKYANLDGSNEVISSVSKSDFPDQHFIPFSLEQNKAIELPKYDMIFQRYTTPLDAGDGTTIEYTVTGVLLASGIEAAVAHNVDPETADLNNYINDFNAQPTAIGHDWKTFDFSAGWIIDDKRAHFVKTTDGQVYKVVFYDFEGSSTGTTTFEKTNLGLISSTIPAVNNGFNINVYPNPTTNYLNINGVSQKMKIDIFSYAGQKAFSKTINSDETLNLSDLSPGQYILHTETNNIIESRKLIIQK